MRSPHTATKSSPRSPQLEKARAQQWRPNAAKNKKQTKKIAQESQMENRSKVKCGLILSNKWSLRQEESIWPS